jgi:hypothetical protein
LRFQLFCVENEPLSSDARLNAANGEHLRRHVHKRCSEKSRRRHYAVKNGFGERRMVLAEDAVKAGMADGVATLDQILARLLGRRTGQGLSPAAERSLRRRELELLQ